MLDSVNEQQSLYVLKAGKGFTCLGFEVAFRKAAAVAEWCGCPPPDETLIDTKEGYEDYRRVMDAGAKHAKETKTRCPAELSPQLIGKEGQRVEVIDRSGNKRRFYVGKSTGWLPIHLEISRINSMGGPATYGEPYQSITVVGNKRRY